MQILTFKIHRMRMQMQIEAIILSVVVVTELGQLNYSGLHCKL